MYDYARGRASRIDLQTDPFQRLATPLRAERATGFAAAAAWVICGDYLLTALIVRHHPPSFRPFLSSDPSALALVHCLMALFAAVLAVRIRNQPRVATAAVLLALAAWEASEVGPIRSYAHAMPVAVAGLILVMAFLGLRGALALRRLAAEKAGCIGPQPPRAPVVAG